MPGIMSDLGSECFLKARFNNAWPASKDEVAKLFTNNVTPQDTDTVSIYTEAVGGSYVPKTLVCGSWTITSGASLAQASYTQQVWTFTGPLTGPPSIYGYYVVDGDNVLQWAEKFVYHFTPAANGNHLDVTPIFRASKGTPN